MASHDNKNEKIKRKPIYKKWWFWILILVLIELIYATYLAIAHPEELEESNTTIEIEEVSDEIEENSIYQTSYSWKALEENAYQEKIEETRTLAVEIDDFDGTVLEAGNYKIYRR